MVKRIGRRAGGSYVDHQEAESITTDLLESGSITADLLNNGGPLSDGDGVERQHWVIPQGASDPAGAEPEDIIFEEES